MWPLSPCLASILCFATNTRAQDIVDFYDPAAKTANKVDQIRGAIESENALGIKVRPRGGPVKEIPAADIRYIRYRSLAVPELEYRKPFGLQDRALGQTREEQKKKLLAESLEAYRDLLTKAKDAPAASRYVQYRIAELLALQAADDPDKLDAAIAAFVAFGKNHTDGWEIVAALKQLAHLQEEKGNLAGVGEAYDALARVPAITPGMRQESVLLGARALLRANRIDDAETKLQALDSTLGQEDAAKSAVQVLLARGRLARGDQSNVEAPVRAAIARTANSVTLATAHNVLGDYYLKKGLPEDAFWEYLRVDVQYGDDREEEAKALYYLSQLFDQVKNDKVRAQECLTRLQDKAQFGGTEFYRKVALTAPAKP
jgi:hypothetical protein